MYRCLRHMFAWLLVLLACGEKGPGPVMPGPPAPSCDGLADYFHVSSMVPTRDNALGVVARGSLVYVADGDGGLSVFDISDPVAPLARGFTVGPGVADDVDVLDDTHLVVAWGGAGIAVVNIENPDLPYIAGSVPSAGATVDVAVDGDLAYVADNTVGLLVVDVSTRDTPEIIGVENTPGRATGVAVDGQRVYVADAILGVRIVNVVDPEEPFLIDSIDTPGFAAGVDVSGDHLYVADGTAGLHAVALTGADAETIVGTLDTPGSAINVSVCGSTAYVADRFSGLQVIDVSNPTLPVLATWSRTPGLTRDVVCSSGRIVTADEHAGVRVHEGITGMQPPFAMRDAVLATDARGVAAVASGAVVTDRSFGIRILSADTEPEVLGSLSMAGQPGRVVVSGDTAFVIDASGPVALVNISDPSMPVSAGAIPQTSGALGVSVTDGKTFVVQGIGGIFEYTLDGSEAPRTAPLNNQFANDVVVRGRYAYASIASGQVFVVDRNNFTAGPLNGVPLDGSGGRIIIAHFDQLIPVPADVAVVAIPSGSGGSPPGVQLFSLLSPLVPSSIGFVATNGPATDVAVAGTHLYVALRSGGLEVFDVSDPSRIERAGYYPSYGEMWGVAVSGDVVFGADGQGGLMTAPVNVCD